MPPTWIAWSWRMALTSPWCCTSPSTAFTSWWTGSNRTLRRLMAQGEELEGFKDNIVSEQENAAAAWALQGIQTEPGAQIFCFKKLAQKIGKKLALAVELDGVACSNTSCNIVERKQQFRRKEVLELIATINTLKTLIVTEAPNTDLLQGKELRFFMMAGSWPDDTDEQAAVQELMLQHHIQPVLPHGSGYHNTWGCNLETPDQANCIQKFNVKMNRVKQPQSASLL